MADWKLGTVVPSLAGAGKDGAAPAMYYCAQVRVLNETAVRMQAPALGERQYGATAELTAWIAALPHAHTSLAGTGAMYAECYIRPNAEPAGLRVQVSGPVPGGNRPWGAEWLHAGVSAPGVASAILTAQSAPAGDPGDLPTVAEPPKPAPATDDDDEADDDC